MQKLVRPRRPNVSPLEYFNHAIQKRKNYFRKYKSDLNTISNRISKKYPAIIIVKHNSEFKKNEKIYLLS